MGKDILKARNTCEYILDEIALACRKLKSAKNWGMFDVSGLNSFFEQMKRKKMKEADEHILHVQYALESLRTDLYGIDTERKMLGEFSLDREEIQDTIRELGEVKLNIAMIYDEMIVVR